jgi:hypothetical protein
LTIKTDVAFVSLTGPKPCRYCGLASFLTDDDGPVHPCCAFWIGELGRKVCHGCRAALSLRRRTTQDGWTSR